MKRLLVIVAILLIPATALAGWKTYMMDRENPDVFNEFDVTQDNDGTLTYSYSQHSYYRQIAPEYEVKNWLPTPATVPPVSFANAAAAPLSGQPPYKVPGFINSTTIIKYQNAPSVQVGSSTVIITGQTTGTGNVIVIPRRK